MFVPSYFYFGAQNKLKQGYIASNHRFNKDIDTWRDNQELRAAMGKASKWVEALSDWFLPHFVSNLVADESREAFLQRLDAAYRQHSHDHGGAANWFAGQNVDVDITGKVYRTWPTRQGRENIFSEL